MVDGYYYNTGYFYAVMPVEICSCPRFFLVRAISTGLFFACASSDHVCQAPNGHGIHNSVLFQRLKLLVLAWQCSLPVFVELVYNNFMASNLQRLLTHYRYRERREEE
ncbi:uncharacterized protein [Triticum aestivum]|uniref:uncharacterized protein n=1 Tax=Triticum aestivum TaxID=4565 RepID=UPI001D00EAAB|nr:uncharacterized protein LOC123157088 [Triticum aestivum]